MRARARTGTADPAEVAAQPLERLRDLTDADRADLTARGSIRRGARSRRNRPAENLRTAQTKLLSGAGGNLLVGSR